MVDEHAGELIADGLVHEQGGNCGVDTAEGLAVTPNGKSVYVANTGDNTVSVIDTALNLAMATVPVGHYPQGVAVTRDGSRVYVANTNDNTMSVIDTATNLVVATVPVGHGPLAFGNFIGP